MTATRLKNIFGILIFLLSITINAQNAETPDYQYIFDGNVKWMMLT